jgi:AcrR family transcriptional regulator
MICNRPTVGFIKYIPTVGLSTILIQMSLMTEPGSMNTRAARGQATRDQLIEVATGLFAAHGYEDTSIEDVLVAAGVSRGALYHHFAGKDALFEAVVESVEARITAELSVKTSGVRDAVDAMRVAALGWIEMARDPVIQRIILLDAPSVLGVGRWHDPDQQQALASTKALLQVISDEGRLAPELVTAFAHMILGAIDEIAMAIALADDPDAALASGRTAVEEFLHRLLG